MHGCSFINSFNRNIRSMHAIIILVYNSNINCRKDCGMNEFSRSISNSNEEVFRGRFG